MRISARFAEFVTYNREWITYELEQSKSNWIGFGLPRVYQHQNARADLFRKIEDRIGVPENMRPAYSTLQDCFTMRMLQGKTETIERKIATLYEL